MARPSHDDQMRQLRMVAPPSVIGEAPVQLSRPMIDAAILRSVDHALAIAPAGNTRRRLLQMQGGMKSFLATARAVQRLPSIGKGLRS